MPALNVQSVLSQPIQTDAMLPEVATISAVKPETPGVATYTIALQNQEARQNYRFQPGQFNMLYLPGIGEAAISISSDPAEPSELLHTIRVAGNVTSAIDKLGAGGPLGVRGPYGSHWPVETAQGGDLIFVGGGIGLAPLRSAIYSVIQNRDKYQQVSILVGARSPEDLLYPKEYDSWRAHDIDVLSTVDRAEASWQGRVGVVPMVFYSLRPEPRRTTVFTCGPEIMMRFVVYEALARRIPEERIFVSLERNMKCAIGFCGHCQYGPTFLCKEGPVLSFERVQAFFNVEDF